MTSHSNTKQLTVGFAQKFPVNLQTLLLIGSTLCISILFYTKTTQSFAMASEKLSSFCRANNNSNEPTNASMLAKGDGDASATEKKTRAVSDVVTKALAFKALLNAAQQTTLEQTYTTTLARKWSNLPCGTGCRNGIQLGTNLTGAQFLAAMEVVKAALSSSAGNGYDEFHQMNLAEAFLHANGGGNGYDSTLRWMAFLNTPTESGTWMLQFGGHHYAANISFNNGHVIGATPFFMGLEPKTFTYNAVAYDPLGGERDAFRALFASLTQAQLTASSLSGSFNDCVMVPGESNGGTSIFPSASLGQAASSLTVAQQNLILAVMQQYVGDMDTATANNVIKVYTSELANTFISYKGSGTAGSATSFLVAQGDYVRISGPTVWIELSCQGGVVIQGQIHYHTIWRDRSHDYGVDLTGAPIDVATATGINDVVNNNLLQIYPNPATTNVTITLPENVQNAKLTIINIITGQAVKQINAVSGAKINVDIASVTTGNYLIKIQSVSGTYTGRLIKQ
jgi:Protein of unknown function (DUF3500)/Secretion system C-terminal sorting domain